jgi:hypothetical protein
VRHGIARRGRRCRRALWHGFQRDGFDGAFQRAGFQLTAI